VQIENPEQIAQEALKAWTQVDDSLDTIKMNVKSMKGFIFEVLSSEVKQQTKTEVTNGNAENKNSKDSTGESDILA